jgi:hypothetical protein
MAMGRIARSRPGRACCGPSRQGARRANVDAEEKIRFTSSILSKWGRGGQRASTRCCRSCRCAVCGAPRKSSTRGLATPASGPPLRRTNRRPVGRPSVIPGYLGIFERKIHPPLPASRSGLAAASCRRRFSVINENALEIGTATNTSTHRPVTVSSPTNKNVRAIDFRQLMTKSPDGGRCLTNNAGPAADVPRAGGDTSRSRGMRAAAPAERKPSAPGHAQRRPRHLPFSPASHLRAPRTALLTEGRQTR